MRLIAGVPPVDTQSSRNFSNLLDCFTVTRNDGVRFGRDDMRRITRRRVRRASHAKAVRAHARSSSLDLFHVARSETIAQGTSQLTQAKDACAREVAISRRVSAIQFECEAFHCEWCTRVALACRSETTTIRLSLACRSQHAVALSLPSQLTSGTHGEHVTSFVAAPLMNVHRRAAAGMVDIAPGMISRSIR